MFSSHLLLDLLDVRFRHAPIMHRFPQHVLVHDLERAPGLYVFYMEMQRVLANSVPMYLAFDRQRGVDNASTAKRILPFHVPLLAICMLYVISTFQTRIGDIVLGNCNGSDKHSYTKFFSNLVSSTSGSLSTSCFHHCTELFRSKPASFRNGLEIRATKKSTTFPHVGIYLSCNFP